MKKTVFKEKYPVVTFNVKKSETGLKSIDDILNYYKNKIDAHPISTFISIFDHYSHTKALNGEISPDILDAKNIVFCFGAALPSTKILAVRPRSIGIAELEDSFVIEFMEAPNEKLQATMQEWTKEITSK
jgi:hypothetical protein